MDEEKAILWQQRIQECMSSGLSVKRWCEEKGVSSPRFYYWKNRLEKKQRETSEETMPVIAHGQMRYLMTNLQSHMLIQPRILLSINYQQTMVTFLF